MSESDRDEQREPAETSPDDRQGIQGSSPQAVQVSELPATEQVPPPEQHPAPSRSRPVSANHSATWPRGMPALRISRIRRTGDPSQWAAALNQTPQPAVLQLAAPTWLRPLRAGVGIALLVLAWGSLVAVALLATNLWAALPTRLDPSINLLLYVVDVVGVCWLLVCAVASIITGAFCLMLALTRRGW